MELRQVITVAIFMFAAVTMKSTFSEQLTPMVEGLVLTESLEHKLESTQVLAALPLSLISPSKLNVFAPKANEFVQTTQNDVQVGPVPGSVVAIVVAVLGLVSVARRTSVE